MKIKIFQPTVQLREYIQYYWLLEDYNRPEMQAQYVYPEGNMQLIFHYGDTLKVINHDGIITKQDLSMLCCQKFHGCQVVPTGNIGMFTVNFKPYGATVFFNLQLKDLLNQNLDLCSLMGDKIKYINEMLYETTNDEQKISIVDNFLLSCLFDNANKEIEILKRSLIYIDNHRGITSVDDLTQNSFVSSRHLERLYIKRIGLSPKQFLRIKQVNYAASLLKMSRTDNLTQIALHSGFYDQAHFNNSFKTIIGIKPLAFQKLSRNED